MKKTIAMLTLSLIVGVYSSSAQNTNLYWDANGTTNGIGGTGSYTSTSGANWTTNTNGTTSLIGGGWTTNAAATGVGNNAIFSGNSGTVSMSTSLAANQIQILASGYTIQNTNTTSNFYLRARNGILLGDGVTLNVSSPVRTNGVFIGFEGNITNAPGTTGALLRVTGATTTADSSVRLGFDSAGVVASSYGVFVPIQIATTGSGYTSLRSVGGDLNIYGNIDVNSGSRLVLQGGSNSTATRSIRVYGNLTTADSDLVINEAADNGTVVLYGTNSIAGNVVLAYSKLGYGSKQAFGTSTVILSNNTSFGQQGTIGTTDLDRTLGNNLDVQGNVTLGLGAFANFLSGNVNLNAANRTITLGNSTTMSGIVSNGGLTVASTSVSRSLNLTAANTYSDGTTVSGGTLLVNNTTGSATGSGAVSVGSGAALGGSGIISGATTMQTGSLLRPGNSPGVLTFGSDLTLNTGANMIWELWANTEVNSPVTFDQIVVGGNLQFDGSNGVTLDFGTTAGGSLVSWADTFWDSQRSWILYDVTGTTTGSSNLSLLNTVYNDATGASLATARSGAGFSIAQVGSDIVVKYIPEPSSSSLMLLGLAGLTAARALRRKV